MNDDRHLTERAVEAELAAIEADLRRLDPGDLELPAPPGAVWDRIEAAIPDAAPAAPVTSLARHRSRRRIGARAMLLSAAAAVVLVVVAGVVVLAPGDDGTIVATADLRFDPAAFDPLGATASAEVSLVRDGDRYELAIDRAVLPDPAASDADLELWLIRADADGNVADLVSLGLVTGDEGTFVVPDGFDPATYDVVDISVEPHDGDPAHSGRSILRGQLDA